MQGKDTLNHEGLLRLAQQGDAEALDALCRIYAPLVEASAKRYWGWRNAWEDLMQVGYEHLVKALLTYDCGRGVYLSHFLKRRVQGAILTAVRQWEREQSMRTMQNRAHDDYDDWPLGVEELADAAALAGLLEVEWQGWFAHLSPREILAIRCTVLMDYTDREVAAAYCVSRETVKTWRKRAIAKLRRDYQSLRD